MWLLESRFNSMCFFYSWESVSHNISKYVCVFGAFCICVCDEKSLRTPCSAKWGCSATSQLQSAFCNLSATAKPLSIVLQEFQENLNIEYSSFEKIWKLSAIASLLDFSATSMQLPSISKFSYKYCRTNSVELQKWAFCSSNSKPLQVHVAII